MYLQETVIKLTLATTLYVHMYYYSSYQMSFIIGNRKSAAIRASETKQLLKNLSYHVAGLHNNSVKCEF